MYLAKINEENQILSIKDHLNDTVNVTRYLLAHYCTASLIKSSNLNEDQFNALMIFLAGTHDIGKATDQFQKKIQGEQTPFKHALAGAAILSQIYDVNENICDVVAAHHGKPRSSSRKESFDKYYRKNLSSQEIHKNEWDRIYDSAIISAGPYLDLKQDISLEAQMIITGLLIMADWIASNEELFPLLGKYEEITSSDDKMRCQKGINRLSLPDGWQPEINTMTDEIFQQRFGFAPNDFQSGIIDIVNNIEEPGIMIIEAPTGIGKTEAALAAAEVMAEKAGSGGVIFGLPTKGTANGMLSRMVSWANSVSDGMTTSFRLAHGDAKSNEEYEALMANTDNEPGITINGWLSGKHRALLSDFVVSTVDQILLSALIQKFIMLLHIGIAGKVIIIDEVHSYDEFMNSYLEAVLSWAGAYKAPVIMLSATLTNRKRNSFISAYTGTDYTDKYNPYPAAAWSDGDKITVKSLNVSLESKEVEIRSIFKKKLIENVVRSDDLCVGIILNTVRESQELFDKLIKILPDRKIILLHSRYLPDDRSETENEILDRIGKKSTKNDREGTIIIGTQVLEQSLDIDFDVMYTGKCPIDLLFQRIGRLHRHCRPYRNTGHTVCYVLEDEESETLARFIYSDFLIEQTDKAIEKKVVNIPEDVQPITEEVYDLEHADDSETKEDYRIHYILEPRSSARAFCLPRPEDAQYVSLIDREADEYGDQQGVRYHNFGINVLLLRQYEDGSLGTFDRSVKVESQPTYEESKKLLNQRLNLPPYFAGEIEAFEEIKKKLPKWANEGIYENELIVPLNDNDEYVTGKYILKYSKKYGLNIKKENNE